MFKNKLFTFLLTLSLSIFSQAEVISVEKFHNQAFPESELRWQTLWLNQDLRIKAEKLLGHSFKELRVRYFGQNKRTAWILDEIGKELPITIGVVIENNQIIDNEEDSIIDV